MNQTMTAEQAYEPEFDLGGFIKYTDELGSIGPTIQAEIQKMAFMAQSLRQSAVVDRQELDEFIGIACKIILITQRKIIDSAVMASGLFGDSQ